jgi:hypothetical protein
VFSLYAPRITVLPQVLDLLFTISEKQKQDLAFALP